MHTSKTDREYLRQVDVDGYALRTWETGLRCATGQERLGYEFVAPDGRVLFTGDDFGCSPMNAIDGDDALRSLLSFLTLRPGDTDAEYFENYTDEQRAFAESEAEALQLWALEDSDAPAFTEIE